MSSSPVITVSVEPGVLARPGLLELVEQVTDPRARRGVRHRFAPLLAVALAAVLAGARSFTAIGEWVADAESGVLARLGISGARRPCEATIRRVLTRTDGELLDAVVGAQMRTRVGLLGGRRVIAVDGKTVRGAKAAGEVAPHRSPPWTTPRGWYWGRCRSPRRATRSRHCGPCWRCLTWSGRWALRAHGKGQPARPVPSVQGIAVGQAPRDLGPGSGSWSSGAAHDQGRRRPSTAGLRRGDDELDGETLVAHALTTTSVGTIPLIE